MSFIEEGTKRLLRDLERPEILKFTLTADECIKFADNLSWMLRNQPETARAIFLQLLINTQEQTIQTILHQVIKDEQFQRVVYSC